MYLSPFLLNFLTAINSGKAYFLASYEEIYLGTTPVASYIDCEIIPLKRRSVVTVLLFCELGKGSSIIISVSPISLYFSMNCSLNCLVFINKDSVPFILREILGFTCEIFNISTLVPSYLANDTPKQAVDMSIPKIILIFFSSIYMKNNFVLYNKCIIFVLENQN